MDKPTASARSALLAVEAFFAACSFGMAPLARMDYARDGGPFFYVACMGTIGAAPVLLAIGAVLGSGRYWLRIPLCFCRGLLMIFLIIVGQVVAIPGAAYALNPVDLRFSLAYSLCLPLVFLALQLPLWLVRLFLHWELVVPARSRAGVAVPSSTIRGMLVAMAFIGLSLAGARLASQLLMRLSTQASEVDFWLGMGAFVAFCSGISLVSALPVLIATLRSRTVAGALVGVGVYTAMWMVIMVTLMSMTGGSADVLGLALVSAMIAAFAAALTVPLLIARRLGYRLQWGREVAGRLKPTA